MKTNSRLREALVQAELFVGNIVRHGHQTLVPGDKCTACDGAEELRSMICAALAEPVKNCEVGTARQQEKRHKEEVCLKSACPKHEGFACTACKGCFAMWSQMPYETKKGDMK